MVICPRCEQHVDETVRTTCPLCFTPLPIPGNEQAAAPQGPPQTAPDAATMPQTAAPVGSVSQAPPMPPTLPGMGMPPAAMPPQAQAPAPPPPTSRPGARVSLTGEVYDESMQNNAPPPSYVGGSLPTTRPGPTPTRPTSPAAARRMPMEAPAKSGSGATIAVVVVLVLALLGGGGWWFLTKRTNPKDQAHKFALAHKAQDWNTVYNLTYLSAEDKKKYPNADAMKKEEEQQIAQLTQFGVSSEMITAIRNSVEIKKVGEPTYADGQATVPLTVKLNLMGRDMETTQNIILKNEMGVWKVVPGAGGLAGIGGGAGGFQPGGGAGAFGRPGG